MARCSKVWMQIVWFLEYDEMCLSIGEKCQNTVIYITTVHRCQALRSRGGINPINISPNHGCRRLAAKLPHRETDAKLSVCHTHAVTRLLVDLFTYSSDSEYTSLRLHRVCLSDLCLGDSGISSDGVSCSIVVPQDLSTTPLYLSQSYRG